MLCGVAFAMYRREATDRPPPARTPFPAPLCDSRLFPFPAAAAPPFFPEELAAACVFFTDAPAGFDAHTHTAGHSAAPSTAAPTRIATARLVTSTAPAESLACAHALCLKL